MTIRGATLHDRPRLVEMAAAFLAESAYGALVGAAPAAQLEELVTQVLEHGAVFVAEDPDGALVGMIAMILVANLISRELAAEELAWWVDPAHRRGAVGAALYTRAEQWTASLGISLVKMVAPAGSPIGAFYETQGYVAVETAYVKRLHVPV